MSRLAPTQFKTEDTLLARTIKARRRGGKKDPCHFDLDGIRYLIIGTLSETMWLVKQDDPEHPTAKPVKKQMSEEDILAAIEKRDSCAAVAGRSVRRALPPRQRQVY